MYVYSQSKGEMRDVANDLVGLGYSGFAQGKNNPNLQAQANIGPIPQGGYSMGDLFHSDADGPDCIRLTPDPETMTFGRSGFLIHGDSLEHAGSASHGCIILSHRARLILGTSSDRRLYVEA